MGIKSMIQMYRLLLERPEVKRKYRQVRRPILLAMGLLLLAEIFSVAEVYPLRYILDGMQGGTEASKLVPIVFVMFVIHSIHTLLHQSMDYFRIHSAWKNLGYVLGHGHEHQLGLDHNWHTSHSTGEKESVLSKNIWKVDRLIDVVIYEVIPMIFMISCIMIGLVMIDWHYTALAAVTIAIYCVVTWRYEQAFTPERKAAHEHWKAIERTGTEQIKAWRTIKNQGLEQRESLRYQAKIDSFTDDERHRRFVRIKHWVVQNSVLNVSVLVMWLYTISQYSKSAITLGTVVLVNAWMAKLYAHMYRYANFQREAQEGVEALAEMVTLLNTQPCVGMELDTATPDPATMSGEVVFDNVSFDYGIDDDFALRDICLKFRAGDTIGVVGPSGSGKSTFIGLLTRCFDPSTGSIAVDGVNLRDINRAWYLQQIATPVEQDITLFDGTIEDNIRFGCTREVSQAEVIEAAELAYAHDFILEFRDGYQTMVGEDGVRLSGGQKQRIAIARALIKQPLVLILDEATSSLDEPSQFQVKQAFARLSEARKSTIVMIAHRFTTIEHADMIVVLEKGRVVDFGTIAELEDRCELFRELRRKGDFD